MEKMPPTENALLQHTKRALYQASIWTTCTDTQQDIPSPADFAWTKVGGQNSFTSKYGGKTVAGMVGSTVNFKWVFSGAVNVVDWGLKKDGVNDFRKGGILASIKKIGLVSIPVPLPYSGRVSGSGDVSSGQVIFTLSSIRKSDERYYGCRIDMSTDFNSPKFDSVYLEVRAIFKRGKQKRPSNPSVSRSSSREDSIQMVAHVVAQSLHITAKIDISTILFISLGFTTPLLGLDNNPLDGPKRVL
ncbi:hypothetical protein ACROYT_G028441 [Oculina patagonica]